MAAVSTPVFIQAGSHPAADVRRAFQGLLGGRGGIMHPDHLKVTQNGTPNMSVNVAEGLLAIPGTESTTQGYYLVEGRGVTNVTLAASTASPRIDLIVATVRDAAYATGPSNDFRILAVSGTPAPSPVAPAAPANSWVLATVSVGASVTSVTNANITDTRSGAGGYTSQNGLAAPAGQRVICTSGTRPTAPWGGMEIYETDTEKSWIYSSASVAWVEIGAWTSYTPTITQGVTTPGKTVNYARYMVLDKFVHVQLLLTLAGNGTVGQPVTVSLPFTAVQAGNMSAGSGAIFDASVPTTYPGRVILNSTSTVALSPTYQIGGGFLGSTGFTTALASNDIIDMEFRYEAVAT